MRLKREGLEQRGRAVEAKGVARAEHAQPTGTTRPTASRRYYRAPNWRRGRP